MRNVTLLDKVLWPVEIPADREHVQTRSRRALITWSCSSNSYLFCYVCANAVNYKVRQARSRSTKLAQCQGLCAVFTRGPQIWILRVFPVYYHHEPHFPHGWWWDDDEKRGAIWHTLKGHTKSCLQAPHIRDHGELEPDRMDTGASGLNVRGIHEMEGKHDDVEMLRRYQDG